MVPICKGHRANDTQQKSATAAVYGEIAAGFTEATTYTQSVTSSAETFLEGGGRSAGNVQQKSATAAVPGVFGAGFSDAETATESASVSASAAVEGFFEGIGRWAGNVQQGSATAAKAGDVSATDLTPTKPPTKPPTVHTGVTHPTSSAKHDTPHSLGTNLTTVLPHPATCDLRLVPGAHGSAPQLCVSDALCYTLKVVDK
jgi:hypothetical protein